MIRLWALLLCLTACVGTGASATVDLDTAAAPLARQLCEVCGMTVDDQVSPRGQALHRDGTHVHFCSIGDMRAYMDAPSPRGAPVALHVESVPGGFEPASKDTSARPWVSAKTAFYVVGFERPGIMGKPVASFERADEAAAAAERLGGRVVTWEQLRKTPSYEVP
ncbi:MAG: nitrous oxide reductase accessory protein NosL [Kiritimatiellia bacterium]|jgi:nitrous oxide reductase accessory protein NosL